MTSIFNHHQISILYKMAPRIVGWCAVGSFSIMLYTGKHQDSKFLILLFSMWVLSPFIALYLAYKHHIGWPVLRRTLLNQLMLIVSMSSMLIYGLSLFVPFRRPAFVFLFYTLPIMDLFNHGILTCIQTVQF